MINIIGYHVLLCIYNPIYSRLNIICILSGICYIAMLLNIILQNIRRIIVHSFLMNIHPLNILQNNILTIFLTILPASQGSNFVKLSTASFNKCGMNSEIPSCREVHVAIKSIFYIL